MPPAKHGGVAAIGKAFPGPGPPRVQFFPAIFLEMLKMLDRCERCGANLALVGLRHRRVPRRYDAPPVTRPTVTETKRNAKDRTAAERMRRRGGEMNPQLGLFPRSPGQRVPELWGVRS